MEKQNLINKKQSEILEHKSYLFSTDYTVIRNQETGQAIPEEILQERARSRFQINDLEDQIKILEEELAEELQQTESFPVE